MVTGRAWRPVVVAALPTAVVELTGAGPDEARATAVH
jgi:hypothetical protein